MVQLSRKPGPLDLPKDQTTHSFCSYCCWIKVICISFERWKEWLSSERIMNHRIGLILYEPKEQENFLHFTIMHYQNYQNFRATHLLPDLTNLVHNDLLVSGIITRIII